VRRLDDAIDSAVRIAEDEGDHLGGSGVLVTGSIVTVGEARGLLRGDRADPL
jgi:dihydrofolate synthase/folylpolyglutamate synthase